MRPLLSAGLMLVMAAPAFAGPIGFSYSAFPEFRDGRDRMSVSFRNPEAHGLSPFVDAFIREPRGHSGPVTTAAGTISLISMPDEAFEYGDNGPGSGIFQVYLQITDWSGPAPYDPSKPYRHFQGIDFAAVGEVTFGDADYPEGKLELDFLGSGYGKGFDSKFSHYDFRLVKATENGVTRIDAEYTVTSLDGSAPVAATPEPATLMSAGLGLAAVVGWARRRAKPGVPTPGKVTPPPSGG